jgi:hypothetical protein
MVGLSFGPPVLPQQQRGHEAGGGAEERQQDLVDEGRQEPAVAWVGEQPQTQAEPAVLQGAGDPVGAAREAAQHRQQRGQLVAGRLPQGRGLQLAAELERIQPADRAEVQQGKAAVVQQQDVARVGSAWKTPPSMICRSGQPSSVRARACRSSPRASMTGPAASRGSPSSHSITNTRSVHSSGRTAGSRTEASAPGAVEAAATTAMLRASTRKSSSSRSAVAKPRASSTAPMVAPHRVRVSSLRATRSTMSRSRSTTGRMPGRWTLTTTSAPEERSRAWCTWAMEAAARGRGWSSSNTASGVPSS